jgi:predicted nucleic acid-binding protein
VWVEYLRHGARGWAAEVAEGIERGEVLVCGPVLAELISGTSPETSERLWNRLSALPWAPLGRQAWHQVASIRRKLLRAGKTVPLVDIAIAVAAMRAGAAVWTADSDFERILEATDGLTVRYQHPQRPRMNVPSSGPK